MTQGVKQGCICRWGGKKSVFRTVWWL